MTRILLVMPFLFLMTVAQAYAAGSLTLNWTDKSDNESGFKIERKLGPTGTFAEVGRVGANIVTYPDPNLAYGTAYCYRVRAFNADGDSAYTNEACGTTKANPLPNAPTGLTVVAQ
jgi:hypothetical protein